MTIHVGRSITAALLITGRSAKWLADQAGMTPQQVGQLRRATSTSTKTVDRIANALGMRASDLVRLGERAEG